MSKTRLSVYDGRRHIAVIQQHSDGLWHVTVRDHPVMVCKDRESALRLVTITLDPQQKEI